MRKLLRIVVTRTEVNIHALSIGCTNNKKAFYPPGRARSPKRGRQAL